MLPEAYYAALDRLLEIARGRDVSIGGTLVLADARSRVAAGFVAWCWDETVVERGLGESLLTLFLVSDLALRRDVLVVLDGRASFGRPRQHPRASEIEFVHRMVADGRFGGC